ncbi:MAG: ATP-binding cassette domain-containing protein, partial [Proteobacteria bacterium]|nr:ATP-binding cassette domain-containing protein [Pseudomonadota bacterium]
FSGGEKARLVLALIVYQKPDLLLLDEPTNHLDLQMRHALSMALQGFEGAMVLVSHDRHLLKTVTDRLVLVSAGRVKSFNGDLDDYRKFVKEQLKQTHKLNKIIAEKPKNDTGDLRKKIKPLRNKLQKLEKQLQQLNKEKTTIETQLSNDDIYTENQSGKLIELFERQKQNKQKLDQVEINWLECSEQLEGLAG